MVTNLIADILMRCQKKTPARRGRVHYETSLRVAAFKTCKTVADVSAITNSPSPTRQRHVHRRRSAGQERPPASCRQGTLGGASVSVEIGQCTA
jgi:hypothetical protein